MLKNAEGVTAVSTKETSAHKRLCPKMKPLRPRGAQRNLRQDHQHCNPVDPRKSQEFESAPRAKRGVRQLSVTSDQNVFIVTHALPGTTNTLAFERSHILLYSKLQSLLQSKDY